MIHNIHLCYTHTIQNVNKLNEVTYRIHYTHTIQNINKSNEVTYRIHYKIINHYYFSLYIPYFKGSLMCR